MKSWWPLFGGDGVVNLVFYISPCTLTECRLSFKRFHALLFARNPLEGDKLAQLPPYSFPLPFLPWPAARPFWEIYTVNKLKQISQLFLPYLKIIKLSAIVTPSWISSLLLTIWVLSRLMSPVLSFGIPDISLAAPWREDGGRLLKGELRQC